jgi:hypothetical protein
LFILCFASAIFLVASLIHSIARCKSSIKHIVMRL